MNTKPMKQNRATGETFTQYKYASEIVLHDDFVPATEIFTMDEYRMMVLVTDSLAERILRAGCTGVEFCDPAYAPFTNNPVRYRTATGVLVRKR